MDNPITIVPIVEGHGEVTALPVLLRRVASRIDPTIYIDIKNPIRVPKTKLVREGLERYVQLAANKGGAEGRIFILIDSDQSCPASLGPDLLQRAIIARPDRTISVVLANTEFESWFLAGASGIAGQRGLPEDLQPPSDPEAIRDAKGWISTKMVGQTYKETLHQAAFADTFNMDDALDESLPQFSDSFDKFWRECSKLVM